MKKFLALVLALSCSIATLTGCANEEESNGKESNIVTQSTEESKVTSSETTEEESLFSDVNEFPIVDEKIELTVFAYKSDFVSDLEDNEFTKWYEEKTNVHINWIVPSGDAQQAFNMMIASGEYPDIILGMGLSKTQVMSLIKQNIVEDITDEIDEHGYYIKEMFEEEPSIKDQATINGRIWGIPNSNVGYSQVYTHAMWVYEPWFTQLGIDMPQTTEEFYQMLKAFKENDMNGNGIADEIPLAARGVNMESFLMSAFIPDDGSTRYYVDDNGQVVHVAVQPEFREGLRYIKKLYDEGLLYEDSFIIDRTQITAIGENETPILGASFGIWPAFWTTNGSERFNEYMPVTPLEGPDGVRTTVEKTNFTSGYGFIVTTACEYPEIAVKWADWLVSEEGAQMSQSDGKTITREAKTGELGIDGQQALWAKEPASDEQIKKLGEGANNYAWMNCGLRYISRESGIRTSITDPSTYQLYSYQLYEDYAPYGFDGYVSITISEEDADEYSDYQVLKSEIDAYITKFITGELSLDTDWDTYVSELNRLGLEKYVALLQRNYDAAK